MSARHTPGPYEYRADRTIAASGVPLARCYANRNESGNGPLFAAAPELLEALEYAVRQLADGDNPELDEYGDEIDPFERARAAIAKAEGRS